MILLPRRRAGGETLLRVTDNSQPYSGRVPWECIIISNVRPAGASCHPPPRPAFYVRMDDRGLEELDGDEVFALLVSAAIALVGAAGWYHSLFSVTHLASPPRHRAILALVPLACLSGLQPILSCCAAHEVREGAQYDVLFLLGGVAWLALTGLMLPFVGLSARDDAIETKNPAAVAAVCGAWVGMTCSYAGGNVGEGPTIWTTFLPAALAGGTLLTAWLIVELFTRVSEAITIDRDTASGVRLAGFLIASGIVLGRAVAGNWLSWEDTLADFLLDGSPVIPLILFAVIFQYRWNPTRDRPLHAVRRRGLLPALIFVAGAAAYVIVLGPTNHARGH